MLVEIEKICLSNRYRANNFLVRSIYDHTKFYLVFADTEESLWCRLILHEGEHNFDVKDYFAIDPSGGPFISVGTVINKYKVKKITHEDIPKNDIVFVEGKRESAYTFYMDEVKDLAEADNLHIYKMYNMVIDTEKNNEIISCEEVPLNENECNEKLMKLLFNVKKEEIKPQKSKKEKVKNEVPEVVYSVSDDKPVIYTVPDPNPFEYTMTYTNTIIEDEK